MRTWIGIVLLLALATWYSPTPAAAQQAVTLKLSWDHCAADGQVSDRSFACDSNTGTEVLYASMVISDGIERANVASITAYIDIKTTATNLPSWWQTLNGQCRTNAVAANFGPFEAGGSCVPWYASSGFATLLSVSAVQQGVESAQNLRLNMLAALAAGSEATLPAGQELLLFRINILRAKSTGPGACPGCLVPTCIGFGYLSLSYPAPVRMEELVGTPASAVTWQSAYVAGFAPVPTHHDPNGPGIVTYKSNLSCATGPVPAQNSTWGMIKTMYR